MNKTPKTERTWRVYGQDGTHLMTTDADSAAEACAHVAEWIGCSSSRLHAKRI